jgi:hypothetical protein
MFSVHDVSGLRFNFTSSLLLVKHAMMFLLCSILINGKSLITQKKQKNKPGVGETEGKKWRELNHSQ